MVSRIFVRLTCGSLEVTTFSVALEFEFLCVVVGSIDDNLV